MKKGKAAIRILILLTVIQMLQNLLVPKYVTQFREGALTGEYYANAGDNDVILIGDCEVYENFSPVTLWEEYGITSYIRGSAQQTIWQSYYLLEETFTYEIPQVVIFNVLSMCYDTPEHTGRQSQREAYNRMTLDTMRWSASKWQAICASMTAQEKEQGGMLTYLFPLLRYHERWNQLTQEDFTYYFHREAVAHNGYLMQTGVKPVQNDYVQPPLADYRFGQNSWAYLERIRTLCEEHGVRLVLIKAPSLYPVWWPQWEEQIEEYAASHNLMYLNLLEQQAQIGLDWNTDTYDAGLHLNVYGAEKASKWLGKILMEECGVPNRQKDAQLCARWAQKERAYREEKENDR